MKKIFEDASYIEIKESPTNSDKIIIGICGRDSPENDNVTMVSLEIDKKDFVSLIKDLVLWK